MAAAAVAGCGDKRTSDKARTEPIGAPPGPGTSAPAPTGELPPTPAATDDDDDDGDDAEDVATGTVAVWQAVIDRDRYLARRGQGAVLAGRLGGEAIAPGARGVIRWLVDEGEGNGALAVRVALPGAVPAEGARLAVRGAWALDNQRRWYWQAESSAPLTGPAPPAPTDPPVPPGHQITAGPAPAGARPVSRGKDGGVITFGVVRSSTGDGWLIGDDSFSPIIATLRLPGERPSYGGHDLRHDDERWQLKRGVQYWVRVDRYRRKSPDARASLRALTAPVKVP
ncbi:MAG: hypothetical protein R3B06_11085 [Kofleriaceae bacterium]